MSVDEAAGRLGVSRSTIERQCQDGRLAAIREHGRWWIAESSLPRQQEASATASARPLPSGESEVSALVTAMIAEEVRRHGAVLPVEAVARIVGSPVGPVRRAMQAGSIPACRIGNRWGTPAGQLVAWLDGRWAA